MKVRMVTGISGGRGDGTPWPPPGDTLTVDDDEGRHLIQARLAVPVAEPGGPVEVPVPAAADVEERATLPKRTRKADAQDG